MPVARIGTGSGWESGLEMDILKGKVAVVTGASRGFGEAVASLFAREGAQVILAARSRKDLERAAAKIRNAGYDATAFTCDVSNPKQVETLARHVLSVYGGFDIWINSAGTSGPYGATFDLSSEDFLAVLNTNLLGVYHGSRAAMRHFLPRRSGKLINILGAGNRKPVPNQNAYASSKAWVRVFTLALAREYQHSGVGIFLLQPGLMDTALLSRITTYQPYVQRLKNFMPFMIQAAAKKPGIPARKALWLASSATDGKTGLEVRSGSSLGFLFGFLIEGLRRLLKLSKNEIPVEIKIIPSAFSPYDANSGKRVKKRK
jgi:glucose 1-dehydrogenase